MTDVLIEPIQSDHDMFPFRGHAGYFGALSELVEHAAAVQRQKVTYFEFTPDDAQVFDYAEVPSDLLAQSLVVAHRPTSKRKASFEGFETLVRGADRLHTLALLPMIQKEEMIDLSGFANLRRLVVTQPWMTDPVWNKAPMVRSLLLENFDGEDLSSLETLSSLITLEISGARNLKSLEGIEALTSLEYLSLHRVPKLDNLNALAGCPSIESIRIETAKQMGEPDELFCSLPNLKSLLVPRVNGYRKYLNAPKLKFLSFPKDVSLERISVYNDDFDFHDIIDDRGEPQRIFWNTYQDKVFDKSN